MIVVLIGGLWVIFSIGATLVPPPDLAGKWELTSADKTRQLFVEQSGRFINLSMEGWSANLKIRRDDKGDVSREGNIVMVGDGQTVTFNTAQTTDRCTIRFDGTFSGIYQAHRVYRAFH